MASPPIVNPPMPLLTPINGGFLHGKIIRVKGVLSPAAQRFAINLQCGPNTNPRDDLALHLHVRMAERVVVRNTLTFGQWGHEEKHGPMFPFIPGQPFEILIMAEPNQYKIAINSQHFTEFNCRMPLERVSYMSADGDITINMITFEGGYGAPGYAQMPMPMPVPTPPVHPGGHASLPHGAPYPPGMAAPYPTQHGMSYPVAPGYPGAMPGAPNPYAHLSPKSAPYPDPNVPQSGSSESSTGLGGLLNRASAAVAGLGLATGVTGILGSLTGARTGHHMGGYPAAGYPAAPGYPAAGYPGQPMGAPVGSGSGGLLGTLGSALGAAALGTAILNPKKAAKKQAKAQKKAMKYGIPLAAAGVGAYAVHKGMHHHHRGFHGHSSSSSSSSSEEE